eukprot:TRINITY_DN14104_c0_g1_i1.p1 TRINITY_DN14104_c0_g1~~TRINITY_DN14104_c0_g1_i1.p1  ORF type:complete len:708 (+),score=123.47 TRINITY_DN14104_c0_g1_i1:88-2124(+)
MNATRSSSSSSSAPASAAVTGSSAALSRKLAKVLETRTDSAELLQALESLSQFYGRNSLAARRNLRGQIERRGIDINNQFLTVFMEVQKNLDDVQESVAQMRSCCSEMNDRLQYTREISGKLIHQAEKLNQQRKLNESCSDIASTFLSRFQLTEEESNALKATDLQPAFFDALHRVQQIHSDCKVLLRTQHQRAGLEIMDVMSLHQESAYRRLYKWVRGECRRFTSPVPEISPLMREAIHALKDRPVLLGYCLDEVASTRNKTIVRSFLIALTQGGPNGMPRPIEIHAHDPLRYVGDMLAWIHQALASESELVHGLLEEKPTNGKNQSFGSLSMTPGMPASAHKSEQRMVEDTSAIDVLSVLNTIFEGVCRPFKIRIAQVLLSNQSNKLGMVLIYRLSNLLDFYARTIRKMMKDGAALLVTLDECKQDSLKVFYDMLKDFGDKLQRSPPAVPSSLAPPHEIHESISRLKDVVNIFDHSLVPMNEREAEFRPVLSAIIDPLVQACNLSASGLSASDMSVFMINCLSVMQSSLASFDFASSRIEMLSAHIKAHMDTLVAEQTSILLTSCGLTGKMNILHSVSKEEPLASISLMDRKSVTDTIRAFESLLGDSTGALMMPQCDRLSNAQLRAQARLQVNQLIYDSFLVFYEAILDPKNQYPEADSYFLYKPDHVKTMLMLA